MTFNGLNTKCKMFSLIHLQTKQNNNDSAKYLFLKSLRGLEIDLGVLPKFRF